MTRSLWRVGVCPIALPDRSSRMVFAWQAPTRRATGPCIDALKVAMRCHGRPETQKSDQGSQVAASDAIEPLKNAGTQIGLDGEGAWRTASSRRGSGRPPHAMRSSCAPGRSPGTIRADFRMRRGSGKRPIRPISNRCAQSRSNNPARSIVLSWLGWPRDLAREPSGLRRVMQSDRRGNRAWNAVCLPSAIETPRCSRGRP